VATVKAWWRDRAYSPVLESQHIQNYWKDFPQIWSWGRIFFFFFFFSFSQHSSNISSVSWLILSTPATAPQHIPTQHDTLPQQFVCKYELNCEYCNITLARNKAPWGWSDKIEACRSVLKCFKSVLCEIICAFVGWEIESDSTKNVRCYNKIHTLRVLTSYEMRAQHITLTHSAPPLV